MSLKVFAGGRLLSGKKIRQLMSLFLAWSSYLFTNSFNDCSP
jgi:hypothetical protein